MNVCVAIARVLCALVGLTQHCSLESIHVRMARTTMGLRALSVAATAAVAAAFWSPGVCRTSWSSCAAPRTGHASTSPTRSRAWGPVLPSPSPARTARLGGLRMVRSCGDSLTACIACVRRRSMATLPLSLRDSQSFACCKGTATTTTAAASVSYTYVDTDTERKSHCCVPVLCFSWIMCGMQTTSSSSY